MRASSISNVPVVVRVFVCWTGDQVYSSVQLRASGSVTVVVPRVSVIAIFYRPDESFADCSRLMSFWASASLLVLIAVLLPSGRVILTL